MSEPIDYIDLTQEVSVNKASRRCNASDRVAVDCQRTLPPIIRKRGGRKQKDAPLSTLPNDTANSEISQNESVEVIELDDTVLPENSGTCIVDDSGSRNLVVLTCPICFEELSAKLKPTSTRCGHIFCAQCLELATQKAKKCPTCKMPVKLKSCTRLYF